MTKTLRPDKTIQKFLISTTSRLVGEYEKSNILITHAWPDFANHTVSRILTPGPASRSSYTFVFKTEPYEEKIPDVPEYSPLGEIICTYLSILYGKRFDNHGQVEGSGFFRLPDLSAFNHLCHPHIPQNSHSPRVDLAIPLNLGEFKRIERLMSDNSIDERFINTLNTAGKFYLQALQNFEYDPEVSYLHLITAGEILSNYFDYDKEELLDNETKKTLLKIETEMSKGNKIASFIKGKLWQVKRRFVNALCQLVNDDFFTRTESSENSGALKVDEFKEKIENAYDLRSRYVHTGASFRSWLSFGVGANFEVPIGRPVVDNKEYGDILAKAPTYIGLERIIRYCLLRFIQIHGEVFIDERLSNSKSKQ